MTNITPPQMRELADTQERAADIDRNAVRASLLHDSAAALRAAADQLEAVRQWATEFDYAVDPWVDLDAILTAETAPQEDRDD